MPADIELRAEVLAGIDREIADCELLQHAPGGRTLTALRHLREIVETHRHEARNMGLEGRLVRRPFCEACNRFIGPDSDWCPTLLSLALDYAPQALREIGK